MDIQEKLSELNLSLPSVSKPGGNYTSVNVRGNIAYMAIQFPIDGDNWYYQGKLGREISTEDGYKAMQQCALNVIAQIHDKIGFDKLVGVNHMDAYHQAVGDWDEAPKVTNGASDLFVNLLGDKGLHSRAIFGVERLSKNFCVGITCTVTIKV